MSRQVVPLEILDKEDNSRKTIEFPSDKALLTDVISSCRVFLRKQGMAQTARALVVLRELLLNAITHGNLNDPSKHVTCDLSGSSDDMLAICVTDEGKGFNPALFDMTLPDDPREIRKRGLIIVNALSEKIEFGAYGSQITAYLITREDEKRGC